LGDRRLGPKHDGASTDRGCAFSAYRPDQGSLRVPRGYQGLIGFPCRNLACQIDLQPVRFGVTGLEQHGGMDVAAVVFIGLQQGKESARLGKKLTRLHAALVAGGGLTGSAGLSSEGGHTR
jgi:hypothetical protein